MKKISRRQNVKPGLDPNCLTLVKNYPESNKLNIKAQVPSGARQILAWGSNDVPTFCVSAAKAMARLPGCAGLSGALADCVKL